MDSADRLESWKEIAAYLHRDVRTVQRWEAAEGLPVHRHQHKKRGSVFALRSELDAWRSSRQHELFAEPEVTADHAQPAARSPLVPLAFVAALVAAVVVLSLATVGRNTAQNASSGAWDAPRLLGEFARDGAAIEHVALAGLVRTLLISPDGRTLFAESCDDAGFRVHAVDIGRRTVRWTQEIGTGGACGPMTITPDGERLLVGDRSDLVIVETARPSTRRLPTPATIIRQVALAPNRRFAYLAALFQGLLSVDLKTGEVGTISQFPCPVDLVRSPVAERLWVSYQCSGPGGRRGHDVIEEFDTATNTSLATITGLPNVGGALSITPDGAQLWADGTNACLSPDYDHVGCPSPPGGVINVIRTHDRQLLRSISTGTVDDFAVRFSVTPDGQRVVAGQRRTRVLSTSSLTEVESSPLPLASNVAFSSNGRTAFAAIGDAGSVAILPIGRHPAPPSGLSARWSFDGMGRDIIGSTDISGLADPEFGPGRVGQAVRLPVARGIRLHEIGNLQVDGGHFSVMGWVKLAADQPAVNEMTLMEYVVEQAAAVAGWRIYIDEARRPVFCLGWFEGQTCDGPRTTVIRGQPMRHSEWHHVAATRSGPGMSLLVDGQIAAFGDAPGPIPSHSILRQLWLRLGSDEAGRFPLVGWLDEVEIYNRTLAPSEILRRMQ